MATSPKKRKTKQITDFFNAARKEQPMSLKQFPYVPTDPPSADTLQQPSLQCHASTSPVSSPVNTTATHLTNRSPPVDISAMLSASVENNATPSLSVENCVKSSASISFPTPDSKVSRNVYDLSVDDITSLITDNCTDKIHSHYICTPCHCTTLSENENVRVKGLGAEKTIRTKKDKFQHSWLNDMFDNETGIYWLLYVEGSGMFCYLCKKHDSKNTKNNTKVFNEEPGLRNRTEALKGHSQSSQHKSAIETELTKRGSTFHLEKTLSEKCADQILYEVFACQYWLAKECIANCKLSSLLQFLEHLGNDHVKYFQHRSQGSLREMFLQLGNTVRKHILDSVVGNFGLMVDEVADIAGCEQLVTFIQYHNEQQVKIKFLGTSDLLENFSSPNAEAITSTIKSEIESCGLPIENMTGLATDGAAVMTGKNNGVAVQLKKDSPKLISFHCICHRLALGCNDSNEAIEKVKQIERWLITLWKWFDYSPKKLAAYLKMQLKVKEMQASQSLNNKSRERLQKRLAKACRTRWLSLDKAITGVHRDYESLLHTLRAFKDDDATASGLLLKLLNVNVVIGVYILHDILPLLNKVSTSFQEGYISFSKIEPTLEKCHDDLDDLVEHEQCIEDLKRDLSETGRLSCLEIEFSETHENNARNFLNKYVDALKKNLKRRFEPSQPILQAFEIFNPLLVPSRGTPEFKRYGNREIEMLGEHYNDNVHHEQLQEEWAVLKYHLLRWKDEYTQIQGDTDLSSVEWCLNRLVSAPTGLFSLPKLSSVADAIIVIPVSNAWPERGASKLKLIKSRLRSAMKNDILNSLMQISINGPPSSSAEMRELLTETVQTWLKKKNRRKLPKMKFDVSTGSSHSTTVQTVDAGVQTTVTLSMIQDEVQRVSKELSLDEFEDDENEEEEDEDEF